MEPPIWLQISPGSCMGDVFFRTSPGKKKTEKWRNVDPQMVVPSSKKGTFIFLKKKNTIFYWIFVSFRGFVSSLVLLKLLDLIFLFVWFLKKPPSSIEMLCMLCGFWMTNHIFPPKPKWLFRKTPPKKSFPSAENQQQHPSIFGSSKSIP